MIKLEVEEYCDDCPEFDAHIEKAVLFDGYSKEYCNTNITGLAVLKFYWITNQRLASD